MSRGAVSAAYAESDCLTRACATCGAPEGSYCVFVMDGKTFQRHMPCISRTKETS